MKLNHCIIGDCRDGMRELIAAGQRVNTIITSPPYWGLRDYGIPPSIWGGDPNCRHQFVLEVKSAEIGKGNWSQATNGRGEVQGVVADFREPIRSSVKTGFCAHCNAWSGNLGLEPTLPMFIANIVEVFTIARDLLADDGTLWVNMGDSYATGTTAPRPPGSRGISAATQAAQDGVRRMGNPDGLKTKDLCMMPARVAIALQESGWYLRSQIPWIKRNCMPESTKDRPTTAVEYVYLFSKSPRYFFDPETIKIAASVDTHARYSRGRNPSDYPGDQTIASTYDHMKKPVSGWDTRPGRGHNDLVGRYEKVPGVHPKSAPAGSGTKANESFSAAVADVVGKRNRRNSDWFFESWQGMLLDAEDMPLALVVNGKGYKGAHFATYPIKLIEPMILASTKLGGIVFDPFFGSGTTGEVAQALGRSWLGCDISEAYAKLQSERTAQPSLAL